MAKTHSEVIAEMEQKMLALHTENESIQAQADADSRDLTDAETQKITTNSADFEKARAEIERRKLLLDQSTMLAAPQPRLVPPTTTTTNTAVIPAMSAARHVEGAKTAWGWRSFGEFVRGVITASTGRNPDPRFQAAATTYGSEGTSADGGYALPPDFKDYITKKVQGETSLLPLTDQYVSSSNKITLPFDAIAPWSASGIKANWIDEATAITATKPVLSQVEVQAYKLAALCPLSEEAIEDIPSLNSWLPGKVADSVISAINEAILAGTGSGQPTGIISSAGKVTQTAVSGQGASTVTFANVVAMYSKMLPQLAANAVWLINPSVLPQLLSLVGPGYAPGAWLPPNNSLANAPYGTLLGRPVIANEHCSYLGTEGDVIFWAPKSYVTVTKASGFRSDTSIHLYFDQAVSTLRVMMRLGGKSLWAGTVATKNGSSAYGNVITLNSTRT